MDLSSAKPSSDSRSDSVNKIINSYDDLNRNIQESISKMQRNKSYNKTFLFPNDLGNN